MAFTFPMPLADFFEGLPIQTLSFGLGEAIETSETGDGSILSADYGDRLWKATCNIAPGRYATIEAIKARLDILRYAGRSLLIHSIPLCYPQYDPTGSILGAANVTLSAVAANNRDITLAGFPPGYQLTTGDFLSFQYGSNPVRYALHQVGGPTRTANGAGVMSSVELSSFVQTGYALGAAVRLIKPIMKANVVPRSTSSGESQAQFTQSVSFSLIQTFR